MSKQFNAQYLNDCIEHALRRCQEVKFIRKSVTRLVQWALDRSHETNTATCRGLRRRLATEVSRLPKLEPWEAILLAAANGLLMPQPGAKMNRVLPECRLALDELEARFYMTYQSALPQRDNPDWRYNFSWISQEG